MQLSVAAWHFFESESHACHMLIKKSKYAKHRWLLSTLDGVKPYCLQIHHGGNSYKWDFHTTEEGTFHLCFCSVCIHVRPLPSPSPSFSHTHTLTGDNIANFTEITHGKIRLNWFSPTLCPVSQILHTIHNGCTQLKVEDRGHA